MLRIPGLGSKHAKEIYDELGVTLDEVETAASFMRASARRIAPCRGGTPVAAASLNTVSRFARIFSSTPGNISASAGTSAGTVNTGAPSCLVPALRQPAKNIAGQ